MNGNNEIVRGKEPGNAHYITDAKKDVPQCRLPPGGSAVRGRDKGCDPRETP